MSNVFDEIMRHMTELSQLLADLRIVDLPSIPVDSWEFGDRFPIATSAIYFMMGRDGELLYIGRATNLRTRFTTKRSPHDINVILEYGTHAKTGPALELGGVSVHWWAIPREMLAIVESLLLQTHKPPWNTARG